jgi:hypothetical protein
MVSLTSLTFREKEREFSSALLSFSSPALSFEEFSFEVFFELFCLLVL